MNTAPESENSDPENRLCDFCSESKALLYCRADSAKLCLSCDREVHSTNQLFQKHSRCLLCDSCNSSPASIFCHSESVVLCQNCDWESHPNLRCVHDRRPLEGFIGCPSVSELLNFLGFEDLGKKSLVVGDGGDDEWMDLVVWETPSFVSYDDLIAGSCSVGSGHSFQAMGVPPLPKNRNAACGRHKEEMLSQLRELAKTEPDFKGCLEDFNSCLEDVKPDLGDISKAPGKCHSSPGLENKAEPFFVPSYETNALEWGDYTGGISDQGFHSSFLGDFIEMNHLVPDKDSNAGENSGIANGGQEMPLQVPIITETTLQVLPYAGARELNTQERDSAISRYKEKKKTRRYDKHIRYESRKVRAETRTRIKGRFAKMDRYSSEKN